MYFSDENPSHTKRLKFGSLLILVQILAKYPQTILTLLYKKGKKLVQTAQGYFILLYRRQKLIYYLSFRYHKHKHVTVNRLNFKVICILRGKNDDLYSPLRTPTHHQYWASSSTWQAEQTDGIQTRPPCRHPRGDRSLPELRKRSGPQGYT